MSSRAVVMQFFLRWANPLRFIAMHFQIPIHFSLFDNFGVYPPNQGHNYNIHQFVRLVSSPFTFTLVVALLRCLLVPFI